MKKKSSISLGPGASSLILIFIVVSMMALCMLSLMTAKNDLTLSERSAEVIEAVYRLNGQAERKRAQIDAVLSAAAREAENNEAYLAAVAGLLPEETQMEEDCILFSASDGAREIDCALRVLPLGSSRRTDWVRYNLAATTEDIWD